MTPIPTVETLADVVAPEDVMGIGVSVLRKEDRPLLAGLGCFIADFKRPGMVHATVVRSPYAHARIIDVDKDAALAAPGVIDVVAAADLPDPELRIPMRQFRVTGSERFLQPPLASDVVRIPASRSPSSSQTRVIRPRMPPSSSRSPISRLRRRLMETWRWPPMLRCSSARRHQCRWRDGHRPGAGRRAVRQADLVVEEVFRIQRHAAVPLETRGPLAEYDRQSSLSPCGGRRTSRMSTRASSPGCSAGRTRTGSGWSSFTLAAGSGLAETSSRGLPDPDLCDADQPPRGLDRGPRGNLRATNHSREQIDRVAVAVKADGTLLALKDELINNTGAYVRTHGMTVPAMSAAMLPGPYRWPGYRCEVRSVVTNKTPAGTYRAPGRHQANFVRQRLLYIAAHRLNRDPIYLRRQNLIEETVSRRRGDQLRRPSGHL